MRSMHLLIAVGIIAAASIVHAQELVAAPFKQNLVEATKKHKEPTAAPTQDRGNSSVFLLRVRSPMNPFSAFYGTAFMAEGPNGERVVMTNHHLCEPGPSAVYELFAKNDVVNGEATEIVADSDQLNLDLCVLKAPAAFDKVPALKFTVERPDSRTALTIIGHPLAGPLKRQKTHYLGERMTPVTDEEPKTLDDLAISGVLDIRVKPGSSGSPVISSKDGRVVCIVYAFYVSDKERRSACVIAPQVVKFLRDRLSAAPTPTASPAP